MKIKIGNTYCIKAKSTDIFGNSFPKDLVVIATDEDTGLKPNGSKQKSYKVFSVSDLTTHIVPDTSLSSRLNVDVISELKDFHKKNIVALEEIEKALSAMQVESITEEEFLIYKALEIQSKVGATSSQKVKALKIAMSAV